MKYYWHIHHEILVEKSENIHERIVYIITEKPKHEIGTRLKLLKEVKGELPKAYLDVYNAYTDSDKTYLDTYKAYLYAYKASTDKANQDTYKARQDAYRAWQDAYKAWWQDAYKAWQDAYKAYLPEIEELHQKECPGCPWDGKTIFPNKGR